MITLIQRWRRNTEGTAAIEFAIVVPVLALAILGIIECGRAYYIRSNITHAVDEASRYAMVYVSASDATIKQRAEQQLVAVPANAVTVNVQTEVSGGKNYKVIVADYTFRSSVGGIVGLANVPIHVAATVPVLP